MKLPKLLKKEKKVDVTENIEKKNSNSLEYRKTAEAILIRFGVTNVENLSDDKIIEEFSKLPHPNTIWDSSVILPSGNIKKSLPLDRIDGIIMAAWFAPDFIKTILSDREFLDIWKRERNKKIIEEENTINTDNSDKILSLLLDLDQEFYDTIEREGNKIQIINIVKLLEKLDKEYINYLKENYNIVPPSFLEILSTFTMSLNIDSIGDLFSLSEQVIYNNEKITFIELVENEQINLEDIVNDFNDEEEVEEINDEEEDFDMNEELKDEDDFDDFDDFDDDEDDFE